MARQRPMMAVCLQGGAITAAGPGYPHQAYWSDVFLYDVMSGQRYLKLPILTTQYEFTAAPGPGITAGLSYVLPGELVGRKPKTQAVISVNLIHPAPIFSYPVPVPAMKNVRYEEAVDLHALGRPGLALAGPDRPPLVRNPGTGWRMLEGGLRPHHLFAALPNILIGLGRTPTGASAAVAWRLDSPSAQHAFGGREGVSHVAVSTSGGLVALGGPDGIGVHRVTGEEVCERVPVTGRLDGVLLDDSGPGLRVFCVEEGGMKVWEATRKTVVADFPAADGPVLECRFVPTLGGTKVMLASRKQVVIRTLG